MKKHFVYRALCLNAVVALGVMSASALTIDRADGWLECVTAEWKPVGGAVKYSVSYSGEGLTDEPVDYQLIRRYPGRIRVDVPGLRAGEYTLTIKALNVDGDVVETAVTPVLNVKAHVREGFAFTDGNIPGAYNADGTLKDGAQVLYVTPETAKTITFDVIKDDKGKIESRTGIGNILELCSKGYESRPLAIRVIGKLTPEVMDIIKNGNYLNFQGNKYPSRMFRNVTLEGIGDDAMLYGFGVCLKRAMDVEVRNLAIMLYGDDGVSMDTDNYYIWIHNVDFFYGKPGSDSDQVKGDGSIDIKTRSTNITISNNHFFDSGKVMGCGGTTGESVNLNITYHHNWFDHCDSRCPRLHYVDAHIYNNYYDGVSVYGIGNTTESNALIENNYFRAIKRPMMIAGQGTDIWDKVNNKFDSTAKGTFSNQDGGINKAVGNLFVDSPKMQFVTQKENESQFDAWVVDDKSEKVPETVKSQRGGWTHTNYDTSGSMYDYKADAAADVPELLATTAGRLDGGDIKWSFDNSVDDELHEINAPLKSLMVNYESSLQEIQSPSGFNMSAIDAVGRDNADAKVEIYDLSGRRLSCDSVDALPEGIYIVRQGTDVYKVVR